jgi:hypothetical protein
LAAAALSVFVLFGHQAEPETKVASAPEATAPTPAAAPPATVLAVPSQQKTTVKEPVAVVEKIAPMAKADRAIAKSEAQVAAPKVFASSDIAVTAPSQNAALPAPASAPAAAPVPAPVALAAPVPSAPAADTMARRRESSASSVNAVDTCVANIKAVPVEKQNLSTELTKQLLESCSRSVPKAQWPADIEWAKKLLDQQQEKSLLKSNEKPQ